MHLIENATMQRATDIYHRWVAWSEEDQAYIGRCPDLFRGGVHGDDPLKVARELQQVIDEWERIFDASQRWASGMIFPGVSHVVRFCPSHTPADRMGFDDDLP